MVKAIFEDGSMLSIEGRRLAILRFLYKEETALQFSVLEHLKEKGYTSNNITNELRKLESFGLIEFRTVNEDGSKTKPTDKGAAGYVAITKDGISLIIKLKEFIEAKDGLEVAQERFNQILDESKKGGLSKKDLQALGITEEPSV